MQRSKMKEGVMEKIYTIGEAAAELGMPASTIRFYDKNGLFPDVARSQGGIRVFTEDDLEWARFIERLKVSGMPIKEIRAYIDLYRQGDSTIAERRRIVEERRKAILEQLEDLKLALDFITDTSTRSSMGKGGVLAVFSSLYSVT